MTQRKTDGESGKGGWTMRKEITEEQITTLMQAIPRAEAEHWAAREINKLRAENEKLRSDRRERIATAALQGILACHEGNTALPKEWPGIFAIMSVDCADSLIAKLDEEPQP